MNLYESIGIALSCAFALYFLYRIGVFDVLLPFSKQDQIHKISDQLNLRDAGKIQPHCDVGHLVRISCLVCGTHLRVGVDKDTGKKYSFCCRCKRKVPISNQSEIGLDARIGEISVSSKQPQRE